MNGGFSGSILQYSAEGYFGFLPLELSYLLGKPLYSFQLGAKEHTHARQKKTNLVGLDEKSSDICRDSPLVKGEWVYHCGIY